MSMLRSFKVLAPKFPVALTAATRNLSRGVVRNKALQNWSRPSIDELLVPKNSWQQVHARNQKRYNAQLLFGSMVFGGTVFAASIIINFNPIPKFLRSVKIVTITPKLDKEISSDAVEDLSDETVLEHEDLVELGTHETADAVPSHHEPEMAVSMVDRSVAVAVNAVERAAAARADVEEPKEKLPTLQQLPAEVQYLLVGAGTASFAAFRAIKSRDPTAKILIIGDEDRLPYMRPPLSKELWFVSDAAAKQELKFKQWNGRERSLYFEPNAFYTPLNELDESKNGGISVATGRKVVRIDTENQVAHLSDGAKIKYGKCLLATGGIPKTLPVLASSAEDVLSSITRFRTVEDFHKLDAVLNTAKSVTILGGGFLGSELACAFGQRAKAGILEVNQAYQEAGNMAKVLPEYLSEWTTEKVKSEGVNVIPNSRIKGIKRASNGRLLVDLSTGAVETDHVVVAVGVEPDSQLAGASNIQVDSEHGGFMVNDKFEAAPNLWVAGDAAAFLDPQLGRRRVEHHDHAVVSGRLAGENMTGADKSYTHQSMFWSDLGPDVGYEAIGIVDSKLPTVGVFAKQTETDTPKAVVTKSGESDRSISEEKAQVPVVSNIQTPDGEDYGKGVIFYLKENKIVGVLLWNVFNRMNIARRVLKEGKSYDDLTEVAKLFNIHGAE
ncbi:apoptosis-inducing factor 1, mitochondrial [Eurytemora carolleeae]|uniref:apoptosis-inducing factor 1, mitochondrial n=1 Tax=Eurytemora carolleeae TaxID=1294199 RepID=UPI000C781850|nr:apoptosis-inducing factor 1, mitochondrial [Eurytemora carolleeae]|eukprot:XP_023347298.1 apoptosis-inducing factor 1, mitochondrial-like [Eurytemora affinis]